MLFKKHVNRRSTKKRALNFCSKLKTKETERLAATSLHKQLFERIKCIEEILKSFLIIQFSVKVIWSKTNQFHLRRCVKEKCHNDILGSFQIKAP